MNENELLEDFGDFIAQRARKKIDKDVTPAAESAQVIDHEANSFNATIGLEFKCGVCMKLHRSSSPSAIAKTRACISKLKKKLRNELYTTEWSDDNESIIFSDQIDNHVEKIIPGNAVFVATHKKFVGSLEPICNRINELFVRDITKTIQSREALATENPSEYVMNQRRDFKDFFRKENNKSKDEQYKFIGSLHEDLKNWVTIRPEKMKVKITHKNHAFSRSSSVQAIGHITVNDDVIYHTEIARSFATVRISDAIWNSNHKDDVFSYVIDVGLWSDGFPAMLWTTRTVHGYNSNARSRSERMKRAKVVSGIMLFSTWDRRVFIVHNTHIGTVKEVRPGHLSEIMTTEEEKRTDNCSAYFEDH